MSYYANRAERLDLIAGLIALAKYLEENDEVPAPKWADVMLFPDESSDDAARSEVDRVAELIDSAARTSSGGHYLTSRKFGLVEYRAIAIPANREEA